jgi:hypothetical protein
MVECRQVLKGLHNREPWQARCPQIAISIHPQTTYMKQKNNIWINTKNYSRKVTKIALLKEIKQTKKNKLNIYFHISVHTHNIQIA